VTECTFDARSKRSAGQTIISPLPAPLPREISRVFPARYSRRALERNKIMTESHRMLFATTRAVSVPATAHCGKRVVKFRGIVLSLVSTFPVCVSPMIFSSRAMMPLDSLSLELFCKRASDRSIRLFRISYFLFRISGALTGLQDPSVFPSDLARLRNGNLSRETNARRRNLG